jgi:hypothetical protein
MLHRVIVTADSTMHWRAAFEDAPQKAFDGDRPTVALEKLFTANPERSLDLSSLFGRGAAQRQWVFTVSGADRQMH